MIQTMLKGRFGRWVQICEGGPYPLADLPGGDSKSAVTPDQNLANGYVGEYKGVISRKKGGTKFHSLPELREKMKLYRCTFSFKIYILLFDRIYNLSFELLVYFRNGASLQFTSVAKKIVAKKRKTANIVPFSIYSIFHVV